MVSQWRKNGLTKVPTNFRRIECQSHWGSITTLFVAPLGL